MSLEQTKQLLRTFRIAPNKLLGQNFMTKPALYPKLTEYAAVNQNDVVLDVGAGFGFLTKFLANKCKAVVAVEKDPRIVMVLHEQVRGLGNVTVVEGDVLKADLPAFDTVVAVPPYYLSSRLLTWLLEREVECAVLILQREFANRLVAAVGSEDYGWLTVIAAHDAKVELFDEVPKHLFYPQPEVDSIIIRFTPWQAAPFNVNDPEFFNRLTRWLFTQRNKKLRNALVPFFRREKRLDKEEAQKLVATAPFVERRPRDLAPKDFGELANVFAE
jgi:16S rRNA (adenine1518-N6/adenine1519-N6)-dimethyltransferase